MGSAGFSVSQLKREVGLVATGSYFSLCAGDAQLLHYNGALKPWKNIKAGKKAPLCAVPRGTKFSGKIKTSNRAAFVECARLWNRYLSAEAQQLLASSGR